MQRFDVFIIGGGINGCGIARDAAGRGYSVGLAEAKDLASGTSSWSTKLIHGGLRYLEHYEFRLVREALMEREVLWGIAPHIIEPLRFVLPHHAGLRPSWLLRLGLFLYDHLGGRKKLAATRTVDLRGALGAPLKREFAKGFEYSDARVDDTRLVVLNARDAQRHGASIRVRTRVTGARREADGWTITLEDAETGAVETVAARFLVNAAGPWVDQVIRSAMGRNDAHNIRLVQGSHIVMRKLFDHDRAYIFQNADGRIIFAIPYERDFTLVGTTDRDYTGDPAKAAISEEETTYLLDAASEYFEKPCGARTSSGPSRACAAVRRPRLEGTGSNARLCPEGGHGGRCAASQHLWRQDHDLPPARRRRSRLDREGARSQARRLDRRGALPAAIFRWMVLASWRPSLRRSRRAFRNRPASASSGPMARTPWRWRRTAEPTGVATSGTACPSAKSRGSFATNGPARWRTSSGVAPSSGCALRRTRRDRWKTVCEPSSHGSEVRGSPRSNAARTGGRVRSRQ